MRNRCFFLTALCFTLAGALPALADLASAERAYKAGLHDIAAREFLTHAAKGDAQAQFRLGEMLENGQGVDKNLQDAARWYERSAKQGHKGAADRLRDQKFRGLASRN
jgi:TPR repeat protein